jgi:thioesterase domain-containing protein/acyl carrier protein
MEIVLLDEAGREVAPGAEGEIAVRSRYLALGYWRRPELNGIAFASLPESTAAPDGARRLFRTGDLGRILDDGQLLHLGRRDRQLKIHGNRVEPGEIEATLQEAEGVKAAAVVGWTDAQGRTRLAAYVALDEDGAQASRGLRRFLEDRLPPFMVPARFIVLGEMPLLPNGKIDRQALPDPGIEDTSRDRPAELAPAPGKDHPVTTPSAGAPPGGPGAASPTEARLLSLWRDVLGVHEIGRDDTFFERGGDSLLLIQLLVLVDHRFGIHFPLSAVLESPTLGAMTAHIDTLVRTGEVPASSATALDRESPRAAHALRPEGITRVVPIQARGHLPPLFFAAPAGGSVLPYYRLAHLLGRDQPFHGLQVGAPAHGWRPVLEIPAMSRALLREIRAIQPAGPYRLGGWSFGGFLAFDIASLLLSEGEEVEPLLVVDSDPSIFQDPPTVRRTLRSLWMLVRLFYEARPFMRNVIHMRLARALRETASPARSRGSVNRLVRRTTLDLLWRAGFRKARVSADLSADPRLLDLPHSPARIFSTLTAHMDALRRYHPAEGTVEIEYFHPAGMELTAEKRAAMAARWRRLTSGVVRFHALPGNHFNLFEPPQVEHLAEMLRTRLA